MIEAEIKGEDVYAESPSKDDRKNVVRKKVIHTGEDGKPGDIAHYHKRENETEEWEEPCRWTKYRVIDKKGFSINEKLYVGDVVVPQCIADHLAIRDSDMIRYETSLYRGANYARTAGSF